MPSDRIQHVDDVTSASAGDDRLVADLERLWTGPLGRIEQVHFDRVDDNAFRRVLGRADYDSRTPPPPEALRFLWGLPWHLERHLGAISRTSQAARYVALYAWVSERVEVMLGHPGVR